MAERIAWCSACYQACVLVYFPCVVFGFCLDFVVSVCVCVRLFSHFVYVRQSPNACLGHSSSHTHGLEFENQTMRTDFQRIGVHVSKKIKRDKSKLSTCDLPNNLRTSKSSFG